MCLYTIQTSPVDLTGVPAWKVYKDRVQPDGSLSLLSPYRSDYVNSLTHTAKGEKSVNVYGRLQRDFAVEGGFIHAFTSYEVVKKQLRIFFEDTIDEFDANYYIIAGTLSGMGYRSVNGKDICAESFIMDEISYWVYWV